jgi:intein/homing endonuclease
VGYLAGPFITATGPQPEQTGESLSGLAKLGFASAGIAASGFIPTRSGRLWDKYLQGIRVAETAFPAAILRTFRVSEFLSPLGTPQAIGLTAEQMAVGGKYAEFLRETFGSSIDDISMAAGGGVFGEVRAGGKAVGLGIQMRAGTQKGEAIADYYARITGTSLSARQSLNDALLKSEYYASPPGVPYGEWLESMAPSQRTRKLILGAKYRKKVNILGKDIFLSKKVQQRVAKLETTGQVLRAKAASTAGRLNTLLSKPFEFLPERMQQWPIIKTMAVQPGSATQMFSRFVKKAVIAGAAYKGLEYYDYLRYQGSPWAAALGVSGGALAGGTMFKGAGRRFSSLGMAVGAGVGLYTSMAPRFDEGLFYGVASIFTDASLARAKVSRSIGLTESLQRQEAITPGLVSVKTALGFAGVGALSAGLYGYGGLLGSAVKEKFAKKDVLAADIIENLRKARADKMGKRLWGTKFGQRVAKTPILKHLTKIKSTMALGALGGLAAYGVLSTGLSLLSGNIGAAMPFASIIGTTETPEELEAIYSGEQEVAVRKGRWWEFGRCLANSSMIPICYTGKSRMAQDIKIGDILIGRDGEEAKVLSVFSRKFSGNIIKFKTRASWITETKVTGNHKIPVWQNNKIVEIEAKELRPNDKVEIPRPNLKESTTELISENLIKTGLFLIYKDKVLPAQKNWYSGKVQRSRGTPIPRTILLTPELGRLFGYFLAEGNLSYKNDISNMIETVHAKSERWIVDDIISICKKEFNITPTVRFKTTGEKTKEGCWIVRICSSLLAKVFFELFYNSDRQQDKIFPQVFMSAPKDFKKQLIEGYWRGDGHKDRSTYVISSCHRQLLESVFSLLLNLGEYPYICKFEKNDYRGRHRIKWTPGRKPYFYKEYDSKLFCIICSIKIEQYNDFVYDFEVDHPDHLFQAGTFLVHNSTPYEGGRIEYYRPHMLQRLRTRAYQKGLYGSEEERWEYDPLMHPLKALFGSDEWKYHYETKYQYERPAPLTGTYFEDVPFIGPALAATIGKMIKPRKLVRPEEWKIGEGEYKHLPDVRGETEPAYELGGLGPGAPVAPEEGTQLFNELMYRRREAVGLIGFAEGAIEKALTGREEVFQNLQTLGVMGKETGSEYWLWSHLNVGGALGASEPIRRFIPHTRSYLEEYNPLKNTMPSWMPQDYFLDLTHGNPFKKIKEAEIRLPGPGYEALHPEVAGIAPEEYPLVHKLKILGDVAMWSDEYKHTLSRAKRNLNRLTDQERMIVKTVEEQVKSKKVRRELTPYRFRPELLTEEQVTVTDVLDPRRIRTAEYGDAVIELQGIGAVENMAGALEFAKDKLEGNKITIQTPTMESRKYDVTKRGSRIKAVAMLGDLDYGQELANRELTTYKDLRDEFEQLRFTSREKLAGRLGEAALHGIETPLEMLTPMSPASKLIRQRSPLEEYIASEAIGTGNAFWDRPVENFLKPAANMALAELGFDEVPDEIRQRRDINEYFDMLAWTKSRQAEIKAREVNNWTEVKESQKAQQETLFGLDVFGSPVGAMKALPRRERDFFNAFTNAPSPEERQQILEYIPENEQRIYMAQWLRQEEEKSRVKKDAGLATKYDEQTLIAAKMMRRSEGFGITPELEEQWMAETGGEIPFDDWVREKKAEEYFSSHSLPGADWLGWHPSVDLDDVKLKYVEMAGLDHHDFDLWGARRRSLARKPYINEELIGEMSAQEDLQNLKISQTNAKAIANFQDGSHVSFSNIGANLPPRYDIEIVDKRDGLVREAHKRLGAR